MPITITTSIGPAGHQMLHIQPPTPNNPDEPVDPAAAATNVDLNVAPAVVAALAAATPVSPV